MSVHDTMGKARATLVVTHAQDGEPDSQLHAPTGNVIRPTPAHRLEVVN
ncbi:MAG: hypothetical protein P0111_07230 [Nitrospira sp.]|nr:hypothetical protein [Nitrospira sp.]